MTPVADLPKVFWSDEARYVAMVPSTEADLEYPGPRFFGGFYNDFVAQTWVQDSFSPEIAKRSRIITLQAPGDDRAFRPVYEDTHHREDGEHIY